MDVSDERQHNQLYCATMYCSQVLQLICDWQHTDESYISHIIGPTGGHERTVVRPIQEVGQRILKNENTLFKKIQYTIVFYY